MMVFSKYWFKKHQKKLLFFLNNKILKYPARKIIGLNTYHINYKENIKNITPSSFSKEADNDVEIFTVFSGNVFAEILAKKLKYFWWTLHILDFFVERVPKLKLSFGFASWTGYINTTENNNSFDGKIIKDIYNPGGSWDELKNGDGTYSWTGSQQFDFEVISYTTTTWNRLARLAFVFNTANEDFSNRRIFAADIGLYGTYKSNVLNGDFTLGLCGYSGIYPDGTAAADYQSSFGNVKFTDSPISYNSYNASGWNVITLNKNGIANIQSNAVSGFGIRDDAYDLGNSTPTINVESQAIIMQMYGYYHDTETTNTRPYLKVYTVLETPKTADYTIKATEISDTDLFTNKGATEDITLTLPQTEENGKVVFIANANRNSQNKLKVNSAMPIDQTGNDTGLDGNETLVKLQSNNGVWEASTYDITTRTKS